MTERAALPVAIIGAGPVGLAAAAELVTRGVTPLILEAGETAGAAVRQWGHVRIFSPWKYDIAPAARELLDRAGWRAPDTSSSTSTSRRSRRCRRSLRIYGSGIA